MANHLKRVLFVLIFSIGTSFSGITAANAAEICADGTLSNSSGKGTCSWHGGILGNTTKKKPSPYSDPWGTTTNTDPYGTTKKKPNPYSDPWGTTTNTDPYGTTKKKPSPYSDPWGTTKTKSKGICSYIDRSQGRC